MPNSGEIIKEFILSRHVVIVKTDLPIEKTCNPNSNKIAFFKSTGTSNSDTNIQYSFAGMYFPFLGIDQDKWYIKMGNAYNNTMDSILNRFELCKDTKNQICSFMNTYFVCYDHLRISAALGGGEWETSFAKIREVLLQHDINGKVDSFTLNNQPTQNVIIKPLLNIENIESIIEINDYMIKNEIMNDNELEYYNKFYKEEFNTLIKI